MKSYIDMAECNYVMKLFLILGLLRGILACTELSAGLEETCIIGSGGDVYCWGSNAAGGVGDSLSTNGYSVPNKVNLGGLRAISVATGYGFSCAVLQDNTVRCWGLGTAGQLGNNATEENNPVPQTVIGVDNALKVSIDHTSMFVCALLTSGGVKCWGDGNFGQLGNGIAELASLPQTVINVTGAVDIFTSASSACALTSVGFKCWGYNVNQAFSTTNDNGDFLTAVQSDVFQVNSTKIEISDGNVCELRSDKTLWCKGDNSWGMFGIGSISANVPEFQQVQLVQHVIDFSTNGNTLCALMESGEVACSGRGQFGNLGQGNFLNVEEMVIAATNASNVQVGRYHTCVTFLDQAMCFGENINGQCGVGNFTEYIPSPVQVVTSTSVCASVPSVSNNIDLYVIIGFLAGGVSLGFFIVFFCSRKSLYSSI